MEVTILKGKVVLDTSIIIDGTISKMLESEEISNTEIIIPLAVLDELQAQASMNREPGFVGLQEIKKMRELCNGKGVTIRFVGERPTMDDIRLARHGRIDAMIKDVAKNEEATLVTADYVQALVAEAEGISSKHISSPVRTSDLLFEKFFDTETMSVHLKEGVAPMAKKGKPGNFQLVKLREEKCSFDELMQIVREVSEASKVNGSRSAEITRNGAKVIQLGRYRVAITRPPFSDSLEITIVRPIVRLSLEDYSVSERLLERLKSKAEGVLIAGPPGSGKSTLASSLADFHLLQGKIVKTFESPRDLQVNDGVTQYAPLEGSFEKAAEILLLVRPDYTIFDEVRKTNDFIVFADMRLAGVGMVGVVHASSPLDAVQRFIGKVELGMIPHILDTIIFVKEGQVKKVHELSLTVRVPTGMMEQDLARPVIDVRDFETGRLEYEIYTFGEENVVVPIVKGSEGDSVRKLAEGRILELIRRFDRGAEVEIIGKDKAVVKVDKSAIPMIIGKGGSTINELERMLDIRIDVEPKLKSLGKDVWFDINEAGNSVNILLDDETIGNAVDVYVDDEYLFSAMVGKKARIKVSKKADVGKKIIGALIKGVPVRVLTQTR
ncbi:MAG: PINc/VapC family ATPase [Nitrososphaerales archaeon]